jgi:DNA-directed RNA polymerase specialized sigma24 family protein
MIKKSENIIKSPAKKPKNYWWTPAHTDLVLGYYQPQQGLPQVSEEDYASKVYPILKTLADMYVAKNSWHQRLSLSTEDLSQELVVFMHGILSRIKFDRNRSGLSSYLMLIMGRHCYTQWKVVKRRQVKEIYIDADSASDDGGELLDVEYLPVDPMGEWFEASANQEIEERIEKELKERLHFNPLQKRVYDYVRNYPIAERYKGYNHGGGIIKLICKDMVKDWGIREDTAAGQIRRMADTYKRVRRSIAKRYQDW